MYCYDYILHYKTVNCIIMLHEWWQIIIPSIPHSCAAELIFTLSGHQATVTSLHLAANDKHLVTGDTKGRMVVWDIVSCESIHQLNLHTKSICCLTLTKTW